MENLSSQFTGWQGGLIMSLIAFSIVFLVIMGMMLIMMTLKYVVKMVSPDDGGTHKGTAAAAVPEPEAAAAPAASRMARAAGINAEDDGELVAVITAAITASAGGAQRVLSVAPSQAVMADRGMSSWRMAGVLSNSRGLRD